MRPVGVGGGAHPAFKQSGTYTRRVRGLSGLQGPQASLDTAATDAGPELKALGVISLNERIQNTGSSVRRVFPAFFRTRCADPMQPTRIKIRVHTRAPKNKRNENNEGPRKPRH